VQTPKSGSGTACPLAGSGSNCSPGDGACPSDVTLLAATADDNLLYRRPITSSNESQI
jgi:hypothetical protein